MTKDVKGMPIDLGEELDKLFRDAVPNWARAGADETRTFLLELLKAQTDGLKILEEQQASVVHQLRQTLAGQQATWPEIAKSLGSNPDAARARFTQASERQEGVRGYTITDAATEIKASRETVYKKVRAAGPNVEWLEWVPTNGERITKRCLILDLQALRDAPTSRRPETMD